MKTVLSPQEIADAWKGTQGRNLHSQMRGPSGLLFARAIERMVINRTAVAERRACRWSEDEDGYWQTDCDNAHVINEGTPKDNGFNFCCYCGSAIVQKKRYGRDEEKSDV